MNDWSTKWPTEEGWFWFYGLRSRHSSKHEMLPVKVRHAGSEPRKFWCYVTDGRFLHKSEGAEGAEGWWIEADVPEPPDQCPDDCPDCAFEREKLNGRS